MSLLYLSGSAELNSELDLLVKDNLASMGSAVTQEQGTLAWCEAVAIAKCQNAALNFIRLLSYQLTPNQISVYARRYATIYNLNATGTGIIPDNLPYLQEQIALRQALFGTPNNYSNIFQYISAVLGQCFIDLELNYQIQEQASGNETLLPPADVWFSPLSVLYVRQWQPRDNQDNNLMPNSIYQNLRNNYKTFVQNWLPAYSTTVNKQLLYPGNDGYGINASNINGFPSATNATVQYGSLNTITAVQGANTISGNGGCAFLTDLQGVNLNGWVMPIEVVDDENELQTYYVTNVVNNNLVDINSNIVNSITNRSYRLLGFQCDVPYAADNMLISI